ncbi:hypothetical protein ESFECK385B1_20750 [Escherichia fergusonii]
MHGDITGILLLRVLRFQFCQFTGRRQFTGCPGGGFLFDGYVWGAGDNPAIGIAFYTEELQGVIHQLSGTVGNIINQIAKSGPHAINHQPADHKGDNRACCPAGTNRGGHGSRGSSGCPYGDGDIYGPFDKRRDKIGQ